MLQVAAKQECAEMGSGQQLPLDAAVLHDVVYNHFGPEGGYATRFGPDLTPHHRSPWGDAVNLDDHGSDEVRSFICDNATMWLRDYHFDGLRLDAVHAFVDIRSIHILEELGISIHRLQGQVGRHLIVIAESDQNDPRLIEPPVAGGYGMDAQWSDDFHHSVHSLVTDEHEGYQGDFGRVADLADSLTNVFVYAGRYSRFRGRGHGRPVRFSDGRNFVICIQNHDQAGNRAAGERLGHLIDERRLKLAAALLLTAPCVPLLFMGEEWNASSPFPFFTSFPDPELAKKVCEGRAHDFRLFGWDHTAVPDPQAMQTFLSAKLNRSELADGPHASTGPSIAVLRISLKIVRRHRAQRRHGLRSD
jgi:maltooligosyltrehalose trehalohydrolase